MSSNHTPCQSDSESGEWTLVKDPVLKNEGSSDEDAGSNSSGSDFVHVNDGTVSYHHKTCLSEPGNSLNDIGNQNAELDMNKPNSNASMEEDDIAVVNENEEDGDVSERKDDDETLKDEDNESRDPALTPEEKVMRSSISSLEELCMAELTPEQATDSNHQYVDENSVEDLNVKDSPNLAARLMNPKPNNFDSDSEHSDFIRLDSSHLEEMDDPLPLRISSLPPPPSSSALDFSSSLAHSTTSSNGGSSSMSSSISSSFRFVDPVHNINPVIAQQDRGRRSSHRSMRLSHADDFLHIDDDYYYDHDIVGGDNDSMPSDVDDRCESDISGVADDTDLSSFGVIGDLPLTAGDVRRSYKHRPNSNLNSILTTLTITALFFAIGIGIGHFLGIEREQTLRRQQESKMKELQDDFLVCMKQRDNYHQQLNAPDFPDAKLNAVTAVWKQKYQELIVDKVELEQKLQDLELQLEQSIEGAQLQSQNNQEEMDSLQKELSELKIEYSTTILAAQEEKLRQEVQSTKKDEQLSEKNKQIENQLIEMRSLEQKILDQQERITHLLDNTTAEGEKYAQIEMGLVTKEAELSKKEIMIVNKETELVLKEEQLVSKDLELREKITEIQKRETDAREKVDLVEVKKAELETLRTQVAELRQNYDDVSTALVERKAELATTPGKELITVDDLTHLKEELNLMRTENDELRSRLSLVLYQQPPSNLMDNDKNVESEKKTDGIITIPVETVDEVDVEMIDEDETNTPNSDPDMIQDDQQAVITQLKQELNEVLHKLNETEKMHQQCIANKPADFLSCVSNLLVLNTTNFNVSLNLTEFLYWLSDDATFMESMVGQWNEFYRNMQEVNSKKSAKKIMKKAKKLYKSVEKEVHAKWNAFVKSTGQSYEGDSKILPDMFPGGERFQEVVNKTKETMSKLTEEINSTWTRVKNLSSDILNSNTGLKQVTEEVTAKVVSIGKKVNNGWKYVARKVKHIKRHWLKRNKSKDFKDHPQDHYGNSPFAKESQDDRQKQYEEPIPKQSFSHKNNKKQTRSETLEQKYEEFWQREDFDPDDFVPEDFFEGNRREWKKAQKRFKKIYGSMSRLNEDLFYAMDDDDDGIEDMYEELEDFQEDLEDNQPPEKLKAWLTCQTRWWKSRLQRKHHRQDFVKACGAQLLRWQLRATCRQQCKDGKRECAEIRDSDICRGYTVINSGINPDQNKDSCIYDKNSHELMDNINELESNYTFISEPIMDLPIETNDFQSKASLIENGFQSKDHLDPNWVYWSDGNKNTDWVFSRATEREYHRHKPDWQFKRAKKRDFERNKPWYYKRAEERRSSWANKGRN